METNETNKYFLPAAVILAGLFIAGAVMWNGSKPPVAPTGAAPAGTAGAPSANIKDINTDGDPFIGSANASVTIAFWSDFQCPFCKSFELNTFPQIVKEYVDTGKVKIVMMDFTFLGSDSDTAALYDRSVWKLYPNQYMTWRTAMYEAQDEEQDIGFGDVASIDKLNATIAGIDAKKVTADVKANKSTYQAEVDADKAEAQKAGVNATPGFVIGTQVILGAYPYATFKTAIDALLK
ncbi:MAG: thioredoxin domain-containing protein [Candidatus Parcubacteria bacterium]|nr:thioredoxin domain-containing protein [Candidatus Parcubacteria bacterium]